MSDRDSPTPASSPAAAGRRRFGSAALLLLLGAAGPVALLHVLGKRSEAGPAGVTRAFERPQAGRVHGLGGTAERVRRALPYARAAPLPPDSGYPIESEAIIRHCGGCHQRDEQGRMSRISYLRKTPEGWQASIRRMVSLHDVRLEPATAREIVRYLANEQGLAPEELRPGRFEVERRTPEGYDYPDDVTERTCGACHSVGRVITERRTAEEWQLIVATHRALYPLVDGQVFRRRRGDDEDDGDSRYPVDEAVDYLQRTYPLETPEWAAWSANRRPPRLEGSWALTGHEPERGPLYGRMVVQLVPGSEDEFTTEATYVFPENGDVVHRTGRAIIYTGFQWRGTSSESSESGELREVMFVERGWREVSGRWFTGAYDELGLDVTLHRVTDEPVVSGVYPHSLRSGAAGQEVRVYGANLPAELSSAEVDFGPGVRVRDVIRASSEAIVLQVDVTDDAAVGVRDLYLAGVTRTRALVVFDRVDAIRVRPGAGLARVGGARIPPQLEQFEAIAYHNGPDAEADTEDDLELHRVTAQWSLEEYPVNYEDNDVPFVGSIDSAGLFTPGLDGPNPERSGNANNVGEVWVVATYSPPTASANARPLRARSQLLVTVPLYMRWDPWQVTDPAHVQTTEVETTGTGGDDGSKDDGSGGNGSRVDGSRVDGNRGNATETPEAHSPVRVRGPAKGVDR